MSFSRRMVLLTAAAVAAAVVLSSAAAYLAARRDLNDRNDAQLRSLAGTAVAALKVLPGILSGSPELRRLLQFPPPGLQAPGEIAFFTAGGRVIRAPYETATFALTARDLAVARGTAGSYFRNSHDGATPIRVFVAPAGPQTGIIVEEGVSSLQRTLHVLALILLVIVIAGVALGGLLALLVVRVGSVPLRGLRQAAEHVGLTADLSRRIATTGNDDVARLGNAFNAMLAALEKSQHAQRQLVADASHELRTPIASLRTNLEVLQRAPGLPPEERTQLLDDLREQSIELSELVADLLDTARTDDAGHGPASLRLDVIVASEADRWATQRPDLRFVVRVEPCLLTGQESRLRRAIGNLLDNGVKWSPPDGEVVIVLADGRLTVRDDGPGFRAEDLPYVFDRFYRSETARSVPGSGLGLAIVRKVSIEHGGSVQAENTPEGGAVVTLTLPGTRSLQPAQTAAG